MTLAGIVALHHKLATGIDATSIVLNVAVLYLILGHSTLHMKTYKKILLLTCVGDLGLSVVVLFVQPYIFSCPGWVLMMSNGFFSRWDPLVDRGSLIFWCAGLHTNLIFVVMQFIWRYQLIARENRCEFKPFRKGTLLLVLPWCLVQAGIAVWCFVLGDYGTLQPLGLALLREGGWPVDEEEHPPFPTVLSDTSLKWRLHNAFYLTTVAVGYTIVVWCQVQSMKHMKRYGCSYRRSTQRAFNEFNRTLIVLALTPLASLLPTVYNVGLTALGRTVNNDVLAFTSLGMTSITLVNPLATMLLVRPYRNAVRKLFVSYRSSVAPTSSSDEANDIAQYTVSTQARN